MSRLLQIAAPTRKAYPDELSDIEWEVLKPLLPKPKGFGHPRTVDLRERRIVLRGCLNPLKPSFIWL